MADRFNDRATVALDGGRHTGCYALHPMRAESEPGVAYEMSGCGMGRGFAPAQTTPAVDIVSVSVLALVTVSRRVLRPRRGPTFGTWRTS